MRKSAISLLNHILDECDFILNETDKGLEEEQFLRDDILKRAFIRSIEIIGEASNHIPDTVKEKYPLINWRNISGMRNKLIHEYFGVNYLIVWDVVINKIPELKTNILKIIQEEKK